MELIAEKYKQTEAGLIPEDWSVKSIGEIFKFKQGVQVPIDKQYASDNPDRVQFIRIVDVTQKDEPVRYIANPGQNHVLKKGDLFMVRYGAAGVVSNSYHGVIANNLFRLIPIQEIDSNYFLYLLRYKYFDIIALSSSTTMSALNFSSLKELKLQTPPSISEQTAIATALSDMDALISNLEKLIEKKRMIKQGAMQELLKPRSTWRTVRLKEVILNFQNGFGFSATGYVTEGIPIVTMTQIGLDGSFNYDYSKVNKWNADDFHSLKNYHLNNGDLIIAMTDVTPEKNLIGRMAIIKTNRTLLLNQRVGLIRIDKNIVNPFIIKTLSNMQNWRSYCIGTASLGVQANIGTKDILNGEICIPEIDDQNQIANTLINLDLEIDAVIALAMKYKMLKDGMLRSLLTGKIRLV
jgi:type I restriction enzyme S subunit